MPDYLESTTLDSLAFLCAEVMARREIFLLESEHIAAKPIPVETHVRAIHRRISTRAHDVQRAFGSGAHPCSCAWSISWRYSSCTKRGMVSLEQSGSFADIRIDYIEGSGELVFTESDEEQWT